MIDSDVGGSKKTHTEQILHESATITPSAY
jgi:hypothetical protein